MDIDLILDDYKASLEVLGEVHLFVDFSLVCLVSASSAAWRGYGPLSVVFCIMADPMAFSIVVFLAIPVFSSVLSPPPLHLLDLPASRLGGP